MNARTRARVCFLDKYVCAHMCVCACEGVGEVEEKEEEEQSNIYEGSVETLKCY